MTIRRAQAYVIGLLDLATFEFVSKLQPLRLVRFGQWSLAR